MKKTFVEIISSQLEGKWMNESGQVVTVCRNVVAINDCNEIIALNDVFTKQ